MDMEQVRKLKERIPELSMDDSKDFMLIQLLEDAERSILDYTNRTTIIPEIKPIQRDLALIYYNRIGLEGIASQSQGGISIQVYDGLPKEIKSRLNRYRKVRFR